MYVGSKYFKKYTQKIKRHFSHSTVTTDMENKFPRGECRSYHNLTFVAPSVGGEMLIFLSLFGVGHVVLLQCSLPEMAVSVRCVLYLGCRKLKPSVVLQTMYNLNYQVCRNFFSNFREEIYTNIYKTTALSTLSGTFEVKLLYFLWKNSASISIGFLATCSMASSCHSVSWGTWYHTVLLVVPCNYDL
jgi:hypothetical protein